MASMGVIYERQVPAVVRWLGARFSDGPRSWRMTWGSLSIRRGLAFGLWLFEEGFSFHVHALRVSVYVRLPFLSRFAWEPRDICESWGLSTCDNSVHVSWGHRSKCFDVPWSTWVRVSQEVRRADGSWVPYVGIWERGKQRDGRHVETHSYRYMLQSGEVQERTATIYVERERRKLKLLRLLPFARTTHYIEVQFSDEVGERSGSWKGGTIGCAYEMRPDETPRECLKRMERDRKF